MRIRFSIVAVSAALVVAATLAADEAKKCTASARECEQHIRQMLSGRRYLGVQLVELNPGLSIKTVVPEGPAERADLRPGDRLMAVNGRSTLQATIRDFKEILGDAKETGRLNVIVQRRGLLKRIDVRLEPYSKAQIDKIVAQHLAESHSLSATGPQQP
jgi:predicted metalloprotease with PDZ domain